MTASDGHGLSVSDKAPAVATTTSTRATPTSTRFMTRPPEAGPAAASRGDERHSISSGAAAPAVQSFGEISDALSSLLVEGRSCARKCPADVQVCQVLRNRYTEMSRAVSVRRRTFDVIDHEDVDGRCRRLQRESQLLLQRCRERG